MLLVLILSGAVKSPGQNAPSTPALYKVTVNPEDNGTLIPNSDSIIWHSSTSGTIDYYIVGLSYFSNPLDPYLVDSIAIVYAPDTVYINTNSVSDQKSIGYTVIAHSSLSSTKKSQYDYPDSTIYLQAVYDSCNTSVILNWNEYNTWRGNILEYRIFESVEYNIPQPIAVLMDETMTTFTVLYVEQNSHLNYFVEVMHADGMRTSRSNLAEIYTGALTNPDYITGNHVSIDNNGNPEIEFAVDPLSQLTQYNLLRSDDPNGNFDTIVRILSTEKLISVVDQSRDYLAGIYYYKLVAVNNCDVPVQESNAINNIILEGTNNGLTNRLSWNTIDNWQGEAGPAYLYRWNSADPALTDSFSVNSQTTYTDDLSGYFSAGSAVNGEFCYRIKITEVNDPYVQNNTAFSNDLCLTIADNVRMPNAFIPNNPQGENNLLRPVFLIQPERYELTIYSRWGNIVFQGPGPWDGISDGKYVPEGVYVYHLIVYPENQKSQEFSGYVTVIYR